MYSHLSRARRGQLPLEPVIAPWLVLQKICPERRKGKRKSRTSFLAQSQGQTKHLLSKKKYTRNSKRQKDSHRSLSVKEKVRCYRKFRLVEIYSHNQLSLSNALVLEQVARVNFLTTPLPVIPLGLTERKLSINKYNLKYSTNSLTTFLTQSVTALH